MKLPSSFLGLIAHVGLLGILAISLTLGCAGTSHMTRTPEERALWAAAEDGHPEAQRRLALQLMPNPATGHEGDADHAAFWFKTACDQGYANAQVDFFEFARDYQQRTADPQFMGRALPCLKKAIEQGHLRAIKAGAVRAQTRERNFERAFFLYAVLDKVEPGWADERWSLIDVLPPGAPERLQRDAARWLSRHAIQNDDYFLQKQDTLSR